MHVAFLSKRFIAFCYPTKLDVRHHFFLNDITFYSCFPESLEANKFPQYCLNPYLACNQNKAATDCYLLQNTN